MTDFGNKTEFENAGCELLKAKGMLVYRFSSNRYLPRSLKGFPDIVAFHRGNTFLLEVKFGNDFLSAGQKEFYRTLEPHLGNRLHYALIESWSDFERVANYEGDQRTAG